MQYAERAYYPRILFQGAEWSVHKKSYASNHNAHDYEQKNSFRKCVDFATWVKNLKNTVPYQDSEKCRYSKSDRLRDYCSHNRSQYENHGVPLYVCNVLDLNVLTELVNRKPQNYAYVNSASEYIK
jgi:hypothetical protein